MLARGGKGEVVVIAGDFSRYVESFIQKTMAISMKVMEGFWSFVLPL